MPRVTIHAPQGAIHTGITLPGSKSIANRALIAADLAGDRTLVQQLSDAQDTVTLARLLAERPAVMHCGEGGTTFRFLLAWAAVQEGEERVLTGTPALLQRPHGELIRALQELGAGIEQVAEGYRVKGTVLPGGSFTLSSPISSQYLSALMLIAPRMRQGLRLRWEGTRSSEPYVEMSAQVLRHFGVAARVSEEGVRIAPGGLVARPFRVPPDWSAAAFWYQIALLSNHADLLLEGLHRDGWQGDERIALILEKWVRTEDRGTGVALRSTGPAVPMPGELRIDLRATPDLFPALAFAFAGARQQVHFTGLHNLAVKESDRMAAVAEALDSLAVRHERGPSTFTIHASALRAPADHVFPTHGDHRMAMALAPLALKLGSITLAQPDVVRKSYPAFWDDLRRAGFRVVEH